MTENQNFGQAIEAMKSGKRVQRSGWNGKGLFVFMQVPSQIGINVVPKMQSLPQAVKDEFIRRDEKMNSISPATDEISATNNLAPHPFNSITYQNQMAVVYPDNSIHGWSPSSSDSLAEDWLILD